MKLNRSTSRSYFRKSEAGKRLNNLNFLNKERIDHRHNNILKGKESHDNFIQLIQRQIVENNSERESIVIKKLKELKLSKSEIDYYMDLWSSLTMWPKPEDHVKIRKELRSLSKKYNFYA